MGETLACMTMMESKLPRREAENAPWPKICPTPPVSDASSAAGWPVDPFEQIAHIAATQMHYPSTVDPQMKRPRSKRSAYSDRAICIMLRSYVRSYERSISSSHRYRKTASAGGIRSNSANIKLPLLAHANT
jgi:hypothetical protein